jgi:hypothetical protein
MKNLVLIFGLILLSYFAVMATDRFAATTSLADVQTAYYSTTPGGSDRVIVPAGTSTWTSFLTITSPVVIIAAGTNNSVGATMISNAQMSAYADAPQGTNPLFIISPVIQGRIEISGFWCKGLRSNSCIRVSGTSPVFPRILVLDSNRFEGFYFSLMNNGAWGLAYRNHHINNDWTLREAGFDTLSALPVANPESYKWSSTNYMVYEDELFQYDPQPNDRYFVDTDHPANYMMRYCAFKVNRSASVGSYIYDQHGESSGGDAHVPLGPVIYMNTMDFTGDNTQQSGNKIGDIRGGANALAYSNTVTTVTVYIEYRDDYTPGVNLLTNCWQWNNIDQGGSIGTDWNSDGQDGVTFNVNFFTNTIPTSFAQLIYPHPLRTLASAPPNTIVGSSIKGQATIIPRSQVTIR